ncbi:MAG: hypothetical protein V1922_04930 [bacterium]
METLSVEQARQILGEKYSRLSDKEIEQIVVFITNMCKNVIRTVVRNEYGN